MKYMLMMHAPGGDGGYQINSWPAGAFEAHIDFMMTFNEELTAAGELAAAEGLAAPGEARIVRSGENGKPVVTDGPFTETKEFIAGFWIVEVDTVDRAYEIAAKASSAPGLDGRPMSIPIEVRQVMEAPPP